MTNLILLDSIYVNLYRNLSFVIKHDISLVRSVRYIHFIICILLHFRSCNLYVSSKVLRCSIPALAAELGTEISLHFPLCNVGHISTNTPNITSGTNIKIMIAFASGFGSSCLSQSSIFSQVLSIFFSLLSMCPNALSCDELHSFAQTLQSEFQIHQPVSVS